MPVDPVVTYVPGHLPGYAFKVIHYPTQSPDAIPHDLRRHCRRARSGYGYTCLVVVDESEPRDEERA